MEQSTTFHGFIPVEVRGWNVTSLLGRGGQSIAYAVNNKEGSSTCVAKQFMKRDDYASEILALQNLATVPDIEVNIPHVIADIDEPEKLPVVVVTPYSQNLVPYEEGKMTWSIHYIQLIQVLQAAHNKCNMIHRDVKPANILLNGENLILSDWASSCKLDDKDKLRKWQGTEGYSDQQSSRVGDLRAAVRTIFSMYRGYVIKGYEDEAWERAETEPTWRRLMSAADACNYDEMIEICSNM